MIFSKFRIMHRLGLLAALFAVLFAFASPVEAAYPAVTNTYIAPWIDGHTDYSDNGSTLYHCYSDDLGTTETCSTNYWESTTNYKYQDVPWQLMTNTPGSCVFIAYSSTSCYTAGFTLNSGTHGGLNTDVGQRCIYPAAPGYRVYMDKTGTQSNALNFPGFCLVTMLPEQDAGCPYCKAQATGDPINTSHGNVFETITDYRGSGPFPLTFTRAYNSLLANESVSQGNGSESMGQGWTTGVNNHLYVRRSWPVYECQDPYTLLFFGCPVNGYSGTPGLIVTVWHADGGQALFHYLDTSTPDGVALIPEANATGQLFFMANLPVSGAGSGFRYVRDDGYSEYYNAIGQMVAVQDRNGLLQIYSYDVNNLLKTITDSAGRTLQFTYDSSNRIRTMQNPAGRIYTYGYDANNNLTSVNYPDDNNSNGVTVTYVYGDTAYVNALTGIIDENNNRYATWGYNNSNGLATSSYLGPSTLQAELFSVSYTLVPGGKVGNATITEPTSAGSTTQRTLNFSTNLPVDQIISSTAPCAMCGDKSASRTYDTNGYVSSTTSFPTTAYPSGVVTNYIHDATGLETSRTEAAGTPDQRIITTQWDPSLRQPTLITEPGRTTAYTYDTVGHVLTKIVTDTATNVARTTTYAYNTLGLLDHVDDSMGHRTSYGYDAQGNLTSITNALNQVTRITSYDANGMPLTIIDPNSVETDLAYDARQRLLTRTVAGAQTQFTYDVVGNLTRVTLPTGSYLSYGYDGAHRLTSITDNIGDSITYTLDSLGNRTGEATKDPSQTLKRALSRVYDSLNQLSSVTSGSLTAGVGPTTQYTHDQLGNTTTITDPLNRPTTQTFDALNRLATVVDPQTPQHGSTIYNYDALDRVQQVTDPNQLPTGYAYDAFGDVTQLNSPDTGTTSYTYDLDGNRLTKKDARGITATYSYDALNRLTGISYPDASRNVTYTYDQGTNGIGRLGAMTDASGTTSYSYDARGNTTQKLVTLGGHVFTVGYQYDTADNLTGMTYPSGLQVSYVRDTAERVTQVTANGAPVVSSITYDPFGPITGLTYGNNLAETRSYDQSYRLTGINVPGTLVWTLTPDADDNIISITDTLNSANNQTLGYDNLNRLTSASGGYGSQTYTYDLDGNRTQETLNGTPTTLQYAYQFQTPGNLLVSVGNQGYGYDAMGNLTGDGAHSYNYDAAGRLTGFDAVTTAYLYNGLGQRAVKFPQDNVAPSINITAPLGGAYLKGTVSETASTSDTFGVASVQYQVDGANRGAPVTTAPYAYSWNTGAETDGTHTLTAVARDPGGNSTTSAPVTVTVDNTPPTGAITAPANNADVGGTVNVTASASDNIGVASVQFQLDGVNLGTALTAAPYTVSWDTTTATGGSHTLTAIASDAAGNTTTSTAVSVTVDNTPPTVTLTAPANGADVSGTVSVTAGASDNLGITSVQFQLDGANLGAAVTAAPYTISWDTTAATGGSHILTAVAKDAAGNTTTSISVSVTVDNALPTVGITAPANGADLAGTVNVTASVSDSFDNASVQFQLDGVNLGSTVTAAPYAINWDTTTATAGSHTLTAIASDTAGNTTTSAAVTVTVDNTPPTVSVIAPVNGASVAGTVSVTANASDNVSVASVQFQLDGVNLGSPVTAAPYTISWDTTTSAGGAHTLTAIASDAAGNSTTSTAMSVTVDNAPPTVSVTAPTNNAYLKGTVTVTATAADNTGVANVQFQLDGANLGAAITAAPYTVSWNTTTAADGAHTLTAIARDVAGNVTTSTAVTVTVDNTPPTVAITAPTTGNVSGVVNITANASDNAAVASVQFQLDGANLGNPITAAPYTLNWDTTNAVGNHVLTVIAQDAAGNTAQSAPVSVTVLDVSPPTNVVINQPSAGNVSGTIPINATASDNVATTSAQFKVDGVPLGNPVTGSSPYSYPNWDTTSWHGAHVLTVTVSDAASNSTTSAAVNVLMSPTAPTHMSLSPATSTNGSFTLSWTAPATTTQYRVFRSTNGGSYVWVDTFNDSSTGTINRVEPQSGVLSQGDYSFYVCAWNAAGCSTPSAVVSGVVMTSAPTKPTGMGITPATSANGRFTLSWTAPPAATQYRVIESANGGNYVWVDTFNNNSLGTISRLEPQSGSFAEGTFAFYVLACNSDGCSPQSATVTGTVSSSGGGGCPPPPYQCQLVMPDDRWDSGVRTRGSAMLQPANNGGPSLTAAPAGVLGHGGNFSLAQVGGSWGAREQATKNWLALNMDDSPVAHKGGASVLLLDSPPHGSRPTHGPLTYIAYADAAPVLREGAGS